MYYVFQVFKSVSIGFHHVVGQVFALGTRVFVIAFATKPQTRISFYAQGSNIGKGFLLGILIFILISIIAVAPFYRPFVVIAYARINSFRRDIVFRLCYIVESGIVHNRSRVTVRFYPRLVAEFFYRSGIACPHIMAQAQAVPYFVRRNKTNEVAHKFVI